VKSITPELGLIEGGTEVTIGGENFSSSMEVVFGAQRAQKVNVLDGNTLTTIAPAGPAGPVDVAIRDARTGETIVLQKGFKFTTAVTPMVGPISGGTRVTILGNGFSEGLVVLFGNDAATDVNRLNSSVLTCVTPPHAPGLVDVTVGAGAGNPLVLAGAFEYVTAVTNDGGPRLVSALSTGNTSVRATFSEAVDDSALDPSNYGIVQVNVNPESAALGVTGASLTDDRLTVNLTTASQNEVTYELHVVAIKDLAGNPLAAPSVLVDPSRAQFAGTPPAGELVDTDGDGLKDNEEQYGWTVRIQLANGDFISKTVTSDINLEDTDDDGLTDLEEKGIGSDPRSQDTDGDDIVDAEEWNEWYSDPTDQDSDEDGLADSLDLYFQTSPILADSDGDQMDDGEELFDRNRNPLLSDLPVPQITVGSIRLDLKITSSFTDEEGVTTEISDSSSTSFAQSRSDTLGTSSTTSTEAENKFSQEIGFELGGSVKDGFEGKVTGKAGFEQTRSQGYSSTVDRETARASQQEWQQSVSRAMTESQNRSVTRNIDDAIIQAAVNLANRSDIAFSITNLELSVLQQDRRTGLSFQPIATLRPSNDDTPTFNLGPLDNERGPIIFESVNVFPNLVEGLMREPTGLVFKVVNYDILDEFGRNFAFSSQEVVERTAGIEIDFGDGAVEKYRVATASKFNDEGLAVGITLQRALQIAGIAKLEGDDSALTVPSPLTPEVRNSYGVILSSAGVERLTRIRGVQNDFVSTGSPKLRLWVVLISNVDLPEDTHFSEIPVVAGDTIQLWYTSDEDNDGLFAREEYLYGSKDDNEDSDGDGLDDFFEVREGWTVSRLPGLPYKVFPDPARADSDLDGLTDEEESDQGTDPHRADTDEDGLSDELEINGGFEIVLFDGDADETNDVILTVQPYTGNSSKPGEVPHDRSFATDPLNQDTDLDGLPDGREVMVGTNPNLNDAGQILDSDGDGLTDNEETTGWLLAGSSTTVTSNPLRGDTDLDGILDVFERAIGSNPRSRDTDADTLSDLDEWDPADQDNYYSNAAMEDALRRCDAADACVEPAAPATVLRTSINMADSDMDTVNDNVELTRKWFVHATGPDGSALPPVEVSAKPYRADDDGDGLKDAEEFARLTHPSNGDSDEDGTDDGDETVTCFDHDNNSGTANLCRDPLIADRLIKFEFTNFITLEDCDAPDFAKSELGYGKIYLTDPSGSSYTVDIPGARSGECAGEDSGRIEPNIALSFSKTFLVRPGQTFEAKNDGNMEECDAGSRDALQQSSKVFDYTTVAALARNVASNQSFDILAAPGADPQGNCQFRVAMRVTSLETPK
jgi:hypothetical protein